MDTLALILRTVRESIESTGVPPDQLQHALSHAEQRLRGSLGGLRRTISPVPPPAVNTKQRIAALAQAGLSSPQISQRLGVSHSYVRRIERSLKEITP